MPHYGRFCATVFICFALVANCLGREHSQRYTVQFQTPPGASSNATQAEQDAFLRYLENHGVNVTVRYRFNDIMNGMSIDLPDDSEAMRHLADAGNGTAAIEFRPSVFLSQTLQSCPYVRRYWPGKVYKRPRVQRMESHKFAGRPNLHAAHALTGVDRAKEERWSGRGIKIGILDTGIDYTHSALGGCFGPDCQVAYGYDLVGDSYDVEGKTTPDEDPIDTCDGHGTHVAGIIAANDTAKGFEGVAPGATLGAWRIFGCHGDTDDDIILMAAEMAVKAGMDIINLSVGGGVSAWEEDPLAVALSNIADRGVLVIVAQGNEGRDGLARTPSPAIGKNVVAVASFDNTVKFGHAFNVSQGAVEFGPFEYTTSNGKSKFPMNRTSLPFTAFLEPLDGVPKDRTFTRTTPKDTCGSIQQNLTDKVVLVRPGLCDFGYKAMQAQIAGAIGVVIDAGLAEEGFQVDLTKYPDIHIPVVSVHGTIANQLFKLSKANATILFSDQFIEVPTGGRPSIFSTWGPDPELHIKPDIAAVGGSIFSTYPVNLGAYMTMSGTSMATPYITGCLALFMEAKGQSQDRKSVASSLLNYAMPSASTSFDDFILESPAKQGAGLVQIFNAIHSTFSVNPSKIALNDTAFFIKNMSITIRNDDEVKKVFTLSHHPAAGILGYNLSETAVPVHRPQYVRSDARVIFHPERIAIGSHSTATVHLIFEQPKYPAKDSHLIYGGYIGVSDLKNNSVHIPYFGALGNQYDLPIFERDDSYPFIGDRNGMPLGKKPSFDFSRKQALYLYLRIGNPTSILKTELVASKGAGVIGVLPRIHEEWLARNDNSYEDFEYVYEWHGGYLKTGPDGSSTLHSVPPGEYHLRLSALRIFGNPNQESDWDVWKSPLFRVLG
ncbi:peptidase S8/S53 domain-containing protein [Dichotomocladium elegans]|nr:peptidase S8/S53 domain-containing protein [Dichotomocladium elegans]